MGGAILTAELGSLIRWYNENSREMVGVGLRRGWAGSRGLRRLLAAASV